MIGHIILTIILCISYLLFIGRYPDINWDFVNFAVIGTIFFDLIDHIIYVFWPRDKFSRRINKIFSNPSLGGPIKALLSYLKHKEREVTILFFHNFLFFAIIAPVSILLIITYPFSLVTAFVVFGIFFHLITDIFWYVILGFDRESWIRPMRKTFQYFYKPIDNKSINNKPIDNK